MNRYSLILLLLTLNSYGQLTEKQLVNNALEQLGISETDVFENFLSVRNFGSETLLAIPVVAEEGDGYLIFDAYLVLAENATGKIVSKYIGKEEWSSDAVRLLEISIVPKIYELGDSKKAFGVEKSYEGSSRPNPFSSTVLSLYEKQDDNLVPVLKDFQVKYYGGETDTHCNGDYETHTKTLAVADSAVNGYADLKILNLIEIGVSTDEVCEQTVIETREEIQVLKFRNDRYEQQKNPK